MIYRLAIRQIQASAETPHGVRCHALRLSSVAKIHAPLYVGVCPSLRQNGGDIYCTYIRQEAVQPQIQESAEVRSRRVVTSRFCGSTGPGSNSQRSPRFRVRFLVIFQSSCKSSRITLANNFLDRNPPNKVVCTCIGSVWFKYTSKNHAEGLPKFSFGPETHCSDSSQIAGGTKNLAAQNWRLFLYLPDIPRHT